MNRVSRLNDLQFGEHGRSSAAGTAAPVPAAILGAASGINAPNAGAGGQLAPAIFECQVGGCRQPQHNHHTGFCAAHHTRYMDRLYHMTRDVGRGHLL